MHNEFDGVDTQVAREPAKRAPRAMAIETRIIVRNVPADNFEHAKQVAHAFACGEFQWRHALKAYASKEADGTFTVEFR